MYTHCDLYIFVTLFPLQPPLIRIALMMSLHHETKHRSTPKAAVTFVLRTSNRQSLADVRLRLQNKVREWGGNILFDYF